MSKTNLGDSTFLDDAAALASTIGEEQSFRIQKIQTDIYSENVRLQNLSIFSGLKKVTEDIDSKLCQICKKGRKEIIW